VLLNNVHNSPINVNLSNFQSKDIVNEGAQNSRQIDIATYAKVCDGDNFITRTFRESFEESHFTITEQVLDRLKAEKIPDVVSSKLRKLVDCRFTEEGEFLNTVRKVLRNEYLKKNERFLDQDTDFEQYKSIILNYSTFKTFDRAKDWLSDNSVTSAHFSYAGNQYKHWLEYQYDNIKILGMTQPVKLRDIYTAVNILEKITSQQSRSVDELEQDFDRDTRSFGKKVTTKEGTKVVNEFEKLIVLGKPGAGKTTFLKYIALQAANGLLKYKYLPVLITLKQFADSDKTLIDFVVEQFRPSSLAKPKLFVDYLLEEGKCILLFDGLDEISEDKETYVIEEIKVFTNKYRKNKYVLSCRIAAFNYIFEHFTDVEIADFNSEQISRFISNWFGSNTEKAKRCQEELADNLAIKELGSKPLLLTLLCLVFNDNMEFPKNRAELYDEAISILLKKWDSSRNIKREKVYKDFSVKRKEKMFSEIAYHTFESGYYFLSERTLKKYIYDFISKIPDTKEEELELDSELVLKAIEAQHGIFVERARGVYSFSHLTFQEFFSAKYIIFNESEGSLGTLVGNYISDSKWQEIILLTAGLLTDASKFLLLIKKKMNILVREEIYEYLNAIFNNEKLDGIIISNFNEEGTLPLPFIRVIKLYIIAIFELVLAQDRAHARDPKQNTPFESTLESYNKIISSLAYEISLIVDVPLAFEEVRKIAITMNTDLALCRPAKISDYQIGYRTTYEIAQALDSAIYLDRIRVRVRAIDHANILDKSLKDAFDFFKVINDYLYINLVFAKCLTNRCEIQKKTRLHFIKELLMLPS